MYYISPEEAKNTQYYLDPYKYKSGLPEEFIKVTTDEGKWWINKSKLKSINIVSIDTYGDYVFDHFSGQSRRQVFTKYHVELRFGSADDFLIVSHPKTLENAKTLLKRLASEIFGYEV